MDFIPDNFLHTTNSSTYIYVCLFSK